MYDLIRMRVFHQVVEGEEAEGSTGSRGHRRADAREAERCEQQDAKN